MKNLFVVLAFVGLFGLACSKDKPEPDCDECPDCEGCEVPEPEPDPVPPPEPPEPEIPGPGPELYMKLTRGEELLGFKNSKNPGLIAETQDLEVNGRIAAVHVLGKCSWSLADGRYPFFHLTAEEMAGYSVELGKLVKQSRQNFQKRLVEPNRRCDKDHKEYHVSYCKVSNVRKDVWRPWYAGFKEWLGYVRSLEDQVAHCRKFLNENYDNIRGWCGAMERANKKACP